MDTVRVKRFDIYNILRLVLLGLILGFVIYRICFYVFLGQPLEMGNLPNTAPDIFRIVKTVLFYSLGLSPFMLITYFIITYLRYKKKALQRADYVYSIIIAVSYFVFWYFDSGSMWLFW